MAATVEDLARRLTPIADSYQASHRDDLVGDLLEVERALNNARRRLSRLAATPGA